MALLVAQVHAAGAGLRPPRLVPALVLVGAGQGLVMTPLLNLVLGFVEEARAGMAAGVVSTVQQVGAALGVAVVGALFQAALRDGSGAAAYAGAFVAGMLCNLAAAVLAAGLLVRLAGAKR
ncbi:MAG: hypothetical protein GAK38_00544 [Xylophilus sp.]|nr:MAG: hypothetical protein GAK38_00544 [Xylophilus sp.]